MLCGHLPNHALFIPHTVNHRLELVGFIDILGKRDTRLEESQFFDRLENAHHHSSRKSSIPAVTNALIPTLSFHGSVSKLKGSLKETVLHITADNHCTIILLRTQAV